MAVPVRRRRCGNDRGDRAQTADAGPAGPVRPDRHQRAARAAGDPDREAQGAAADDGAVVRRVADRAAAQDCRAAQRNLVARHGRQDAAAGPGQRRARADHRQSSQWQEDRDRPAWRGHHVDPIARAAQHRSGPSARDDDAGGRAESLHHADLPRAGRLGRARQDGEVGAGHGASA